MTFMCLVNSVIANAPKAEDKLEAKYEIGKACNKAREILCSDEAFLDWVWSNVIAECSADIEEVTPNTLISWRCVFRRT